MRPLLRTGVWGICAVAAVSGAVYAGRSDFGAPRAQLALWLDGQAGRRYILQSSTNLLTWSPFSTNTLTTNSCRVYVAMTNAAGMFYRGLLSVP